MALTDEAGHTLFYHVKVELAVKKHTSKIMFY